MYRGKDIEWWMDAAGILDERYDAVDDINRARRVPSLQLTGSDTRLTLDLNGPSAIGVRIVGRLAGIHGSKVLFSGLLRNQCALSDLKMNRLLNTIDEWAANNGLDREVEAPSRLPPTQVETEPPSGGCTLAPDAYLFTVIDRAITAELSKLPKRS
jgi:putative flavoprotein involved in K+ transport